MPVRLRRAYEAATDADGRRYLIDRLWPRGVRRGELRLDDWLKELAPSPELRTWFGHDPSKYPGFRRRFRTELGHRGELVDRLAREATTGPVTLVFAARDPEHCNATVLKELLEERLRPVGSRVGVSGAARRRKTRRALRP